MHRPALGVKFLFCRVRGAVCSELEAEVDSEGLVEFGD
jgi:hypothetical protein